MFGRMPPEIKLIQKQKEGRNYSRDDEIHIVCIFFESNIQIEIFMEPLEYSVRIPMGWAAP
jgi:hypothetical protein